MLSLFEHGRKLVRYTLAEGLLRLPKEDLSESQLDRAVIISGATATSEGTMLFQAVVRSNPHNRLLQEQIVQIVRSCNGAGTCSADVAARVSTYLNAPRGGTDEERSLAIIEKIASMERTFWRLAAMDIPARRPVDLRWAQTFDQVAR